jgi:hypothetical protein
MPPGLSYRPVAPLVCTVNAIEIDLGELGRNLGLGARAGQGKAVMKLWPALRRSTWAPRMPDLRAKKAALQGNLDALQAQLLNRDTTPSWPRMLDGFVPDSEKPPTRPPSNPANKYWALWSRTSSSDPNASSSATRSPGSITPFDPPVIGCA